MDFKNKSRLLGIDFGTKRVGLALSDEGKTLAFPNSVIAQDEDTLEMITAICARESVELVVLGLPLGFGGQETDMTKHVREFGEQLKGAGIEFEYEPELLSSKEAWRSGGSNKIDASAAAIVLQSFLDRKKNMLR
ncbi:MAG: Holliday junction resolvase RuvX [Patescibacteria group bacterium]